MKKHFEENAALLALSTGLFSASLVVGLIFFYGLDKLSLAPEKFLAKEAQS